jgi:hypothetical protein
VVGVKLSSSFLVFCLDRSEVCLFNSIQHKNSRESNSCHLISLPSFDRGAAKELALPISVILKYLNEPPWRSRDVSGRMNDRQPRPERNECTTLRKNHEEAIKAF